MVTATVYCVLIQEPRHKLGARPSHPVFGIVVACRPPVFLSGPLEEPVAKTFVRSWGCFSQMPLTLCGGSPVSVVTIPGAFVGLGT